MKKLLISLIVCLALLLSACAKTEIRPVSEGSEAAAPDAEAQVISFETTDMEGNPVSSAELFAEHSYTMVNVWTSWCVYCVREMPELERLSQTCADKDIAVVGLLYDGADAQGRADAEDILAQTGVTYRNLLPWDGMEGALRVQAFPTTFFVDSAGRLLGDVIQGADIAAYEQQIETLLGD